MDGVEQVGEFPPRDGPRLVRIAVVFSVEIAGEGVIPLAVGGAPLVALRGVELRPEHRGQGGVKPEKRHGHPQNLLRLDERRRLQLPAQRRPEMGGRRWAGGG